MKINREGFISWSSFLRVNTWKVNGFSNVSTKVSRGIPAHYSLKTFLYILRYYTIKNGHFSEAIKKLLEGCKLSSVLGCFCRINRTLQLRIRHEARGDPPSSTQGLTNLICACTNFHAHKMILPIRSCTQNYVCIKQWRRALICIV